MGTPAEQLPGVVLPAGLGAGKASLATAIARCLRSASFGAAPTVAGGPGITGEAARQAFGRARRHARAWGSRRGAVRAGLTALARSLGVDVVRACTWMPMGPDDLPVILTAVPGTPGRPAVACDSAAGPVRVRARLPAPQARAVAGSYGMTARQLTGAEAFPSARRKPGSGTACANRAPPASADDE